MALTQPQITADNLPQIGDSYTFSYTSDQIDPEVLDAASGPNQVWDFSDHSNSIQGEISVVAPASTPFAESFPEANVVLKHGFDLYEFCNSTTDTFEQVGYAASFQGHVMNFVNAKLLLSFPLNHQTNFSDSFNGSLDQGFIVSGVEGFTALSGDGYGTLILPSGAYPNCVRYRSTVTQSVTTGNYLVTSTSTRWTWLSADHRYIMAMVVMETHTDFPGETFYSTSLRMLSPTSVEAAPSPSTFKVYPNPVQSGGDLVLDWQATESVELTLLNLAGQIVFNDRVALTAGRNSLNAAVAAQPAGVYFIRVVDAKGALSVQHLVIR
jgi:hypothetical protein